MPKKMKRLAYLALGFLCIFLGILGVLLPLLPTTPFLILAAMSFSKSSPKYHHWLLHNKYFGPIISNWERYHCIPKKAKQISFVMITIFGSSSLYVIPLWWVKGITLSLILYALYFIYKIPLCRDNHAYEKRDFRDIPCVIFAGGKSSRMKQNKALLPFSQSKTLLDYQVKRLMKYFHRIYISSKEPQLFKNTKAQFIDESKFLDIYAPTVGLLSSFQTLQSENYFFALSVDTPFVDESIFNKLAEIDINLYDAIIIRTPLGLHPLCGIYNRSIESKIKTMVDKNDHKLSKLLAQSSVCYVDIDDEDLLMNLNTPQDYQKALKKLDAGQNK